MRSTTTRLIGLIVIVAGCTTGEGSSGSIDGSFRFDGSFDAGQTDTGPTDEETCTEESKGSTLGESCASTSDCDDGCFCNGLELCMEGKCVKGAARCKDEIDCTADSCDEAADECVHEPQHEMCQDDDACNGMEICSLERGECVPGEPLFCNDEDACTIDSCDTEEGCVFQPRDLDGDGFVSGSCGGEDCDDDPRTGTEINPEAEEDCENGRDDDCDGLRDFHDDDCVAENDTCDSARVLEGAGTYSASTRSLSDDYTLDCKDSGPDAVFKFTLEEKSDVRATVSGGSEAALTIRPAGDCASGPGMRCASGTPATVLQRSLEAGDYAIIVKTTSGAAFDLNLRIEDPTEPPPVDVCNADTEDVSGGGTFTGMYFDVGDDYSVSCHSGDWKDVAYQFTIDEPKDVHISASSSGGGFFNQTYVSLVSDCEDPGTTLQCDSGGTASLTQRGLDPGTYYILLEPAERDASSWSLDVEITDPVPREPGDACSTVIDITDAEGSADLSDMEFDSGTSCGGSGSFYQDVFFEFTLTEKRDVELTTDGGFSHSVALAQECGVTGSELRCRDVDSPHTQNFRSLDAGTYYVVVNTSSSFGDATASITTSEPTPVPENDRCDGSIDVSGGYSSTDTLLGFTDDVEACASGTQPDAFYVLNLSSEKNVAALADRDSTGDITLTLRADDCAGATDVACGSGDESDTAAINEMVSAGTYYLIVEQPADELGDFDLSVFVTDP